jgi:hypothetical protein
MLVLFLLECCPSSNQEDVIKEEKKKAEKNKKASFGYPSLLYSILDLSIWTVMLSSIQLQFSTLDMFVRNIRILERQKKILTY